MTEILHYHHPERDQYSLYFISGDKTARDKRAIELTRESDVTFIDEVDQVDGEQVYLLYIKNAPDSVVPGFEGEKEVIEWLEKQFTTDEQQVVNTVIKIFDEILTEKEEEGHSFSTYKRMDLEEVPTVLNRVEWRQQVPEVAAELLSHFILAHPMPNTNHRTAIVLVDRYLTSIDESFNMPDTGEEIQNAFSRFATTSEN